MINKCKFAGSKHCDSHGICSYNANLSIKNSTLSGHSGAAILLNLQKENVCSIYLCEIRENNFGVMSCGPNKKSKIKDCFL